MNSILEVYHSDKKIRKGVNYDGGYVIIELDGGYDCYLSCGVGNEESFTRDFLASYKLNKEDCYAFDGTVNDYPWDYTTSINFINKNINNFNNENNTDLFEIITNYNDIFLKMDIEGGEYPWLLAVNVETLHKFKQIVIECHGINDDSWGCRLSDKMNCLKKLNTTHYLVHAHGNNNSHVTDKIPDVIELTYVNKKCFSSTPAKNNKAFPIDKLDYPNNLNYKDHDLNFYPFISDLGAVIQPDLFIPILQMTDSEVVSKVWSNLGAANPYWSVLTDARFDKDNFDKNAADFWKSGVDVVNFIKEVLALVEPGRNLTSILDYGCGVGRIMKGWDSNLVQGCDISQPHLDICQDNCPGATLHKIEPGTCPRGFDLIYSVITLQHNRPELMKKCIESICKALNKDGLAFLHVPYFIEQIHRSDELMEMNFITKAEFMEVIKPYCNLIHTTEKWDLCGGGIKNTCYIIKKANKVSANDLQIHLQNLANQGTLTVQIACSDTEAVKIGFWNDCIVKERNEDILTFFKRTPTLPDRPWQDEILKNLATITTAVEDLPAVDPEGNVITDISGYIMDVTKFANLRR